MKVNKILLTLSLLLIALICIGCAAASEDNNVTDDSSILELNNESDYNLNEDTLGVSQDNSVLSAKTIEVDNYGEEHNEMNEHTIRDKLATANAGDTILIKGNNYEHVHITIDKPLTIKSTVGTGLSPCTSKAVSGNQGIFYLTSEASGTIIEGFNFYGNNFMDDEGYGILVRGASNVIIRNCNFSNYDPDSLKNYGDSIRLEDAQNTQIYDVNIKNAINGIRIKDSPRVSIKNSDIKYCDISGITISGTSSYPTISYSNITNNKRYGIELTSSDNINILSNYIANNDVYGVFVNCEIIQFNVIGNFFYVNKLGDIFLTVNPLREGGEKFEFVNNNYMVSDFAESQRPIDVYGSGGVFLGYAFVIDEYVSCPKIFFKYGEERWYQGHYSLKLSEVTQSKKGLYTISIVDENGNVAEGLSSVPVTFYLNKNNNYVSPQAGDVYRTVMMVDGTATARFYPEEFKETGNVLTVVTPGNQPKLSDNNYVNVKTFTIDDKSIPGTPTPTRISLSNLVTYPNSNVDYIITLTDINNNPIANEYVTFTINSQTIKAKTNAKGKATIKINKNPGSYNVKVSYPGDGFDYESTSASAKITVNKLSTKITAPNYAMLINKADYYQLTLKDANGKVISKQKVTIKVNKKTYNVKTNAKGVAKVKLKLKKGSYKVVINYKGNSQYKASKATKKITVKKVLKTKLTAPKVTIAPSTSTKYVVTLKNENGKAIKGQKVIIKVNGKKYTKKTNAKGQATVKVKFTKQKTYKVSAIYKGSKKYKKSSATGKITVKKIATAISAPNMVTTPNVSNSYTVTLKTSSGKVLAKQSLKISLNGKTYTKSTDNNGKVTIQVSFANENTYKATVTYAGNAIYKNAKAVGTIKVSITKTKLTSYDKSFSINSAEDYLITLKDASGNALANEPITYNLDNKSYSQNTDVNGQVKVNISSLSIGSHNIVANHAQNGNYAASSSSSTITILNKTGITFVDAGLPNDEIQGILDKSTNPIVFLANTYNDVSLTIDRVLNITFQENTTFNGKANSPVLTIAVSNFNLSNFVINANEGSGIVVQNADNVVLSNNKISNTLDSSKISRYNSGEITIPGNGICLLNASNVNISKNDVKSFGNALFAQNSEKIEINNNNLSLSNYGITYDVGVKNTNISNNLITKNIGLYVMDVPEGPLGYGIFLNQSAVNVSIANNRILDNYMGISIDSNFSTGIVIVKNWISDNALEGIRFNAGYDLAENAVEPNVNDNAIYRNARGPSMWILGELSANPEGIYHYGEFNDSAKLQLGANWFGRNARITWDYITNKTGYGTMCPRINATYISVKEIEVVNPGTYQVKFYKYDEVASELPEFEMYAALNDNSEVKFNVVNGVGTFSFDSGYIPGNNTIKIFIGSLDDPYQRNFKPVLNKTLDSSEVPS